MMKSTAGATDCGGIAIAVSSFKKDDAHKRTRRGHKGALQLHNLPLDTLSDVMSLLSFKEAARMSLLLSQWRHLWRSCMRDLVFTSETMCRPTAMSREEQDREAFIRNVECVLCQLDPTTPRDKFVLEFKLINTNVQPHVDRWVTFCAESRAKHIVFDFKPGSWGKHDNSFSFPLHLFINGAPAVRSLCLMSAYLNPLPGFCGFTNLRKLKLDSVSGDIQCLLLPACSMLEWLSITRCTLHSLTTSHPLRRLRYLCVRCCFDVHKLEVQAPNLNTFMFDSLEARPVPFMIDGCVEIQEVTIKLPTYRSDLFDYAFADHGMANVPKLSVELTIDAKVPGCAKCPSKFVNLKHLILTVDVVVRDSRTSGVLRLACLLELSPVLKHLELHLLCVLRTGEMLRPIEELPPAREPHYRLKTLLMTGVYGYNNFFVLALHYARAATALERMVIDPEARKRYVLTRDAIEEDAVHHGRRMANEHLRGRGLDGILTIL